MINATSVDQNDASSNTVKARLEWVWPDEDSNFTAVTVDKNTGIVTVLDPSELDADYDDRNVRQRVVLENGNDEIFEVEPFGNGGWRIVPSLLEDFVDAADALED